MTDAAEGYAEVHGLIGAATGLLVGAMFPRSACPGAVVVPGTGTRDESS